MRRATLISFILLTCLAAVPSGAGVNYWTPIGPDGGEVLAVAADPQRAGVVFAGTRNGVFKSTDGGTAWVRTGRGLKGNAVTVLAVAPSSSAMVYAGTNNGLYVSRDGGATWQGPRLAPQLAVLSIAVDPRDARRVWVGTMIGLYSSRDGAATWGASEAALAASASEEIEIARVPEVVFDPVRPDILYAVILGMEDEEYGDTGILKITDDGKTWKLLDKTMDLADFETRLAVDPTAPNVVYASFYTYGPDGHARGVTFRSTNGGGTWSATAGGYPIAVDRKGVAYAGNRRSLDHGATWQKAAAPPWPVDYAASPASDGTLWAATQSGLFRTRDRASSWQASMGGLHATTVGSISVDPEQPRVIYAGVSELGVIKTLSSGLRWRSAGSGLPGGLLALDPREPQTVYLAWDDGFARSDDGGSHWTVLGESNADVYDPYSLVVDPTGIVYLTGRGADPGDESCRLARSNDRGATFRCLPPFVDREPGRLIPDPARPGTIWGLAQRNLLWKTADHGSTWTEIRPQGLEHAGEPRSLLLDPARPALLLLGTERLFHDDRPERVWRSDDGGLSWRAWGKGLPVISSVTELLMDPQQPSVVYAAVSAWFDSSRGEADPSGVYWSRDGGRTFKPLRDGLPGRVLRLILDPKDPRKLYATTPENGIYTFMRK